MPSFTKALPRLGGGLVPKPAVSVTDSGKSDLLMRFFESEWFDAWIALMYLYKTTSPGVQDYLCNRLYTLPEQDVESYLSQLTQLCMLRPNSSLERVLIDLCSRSLRLAIKTYWLLLAISQDNPNDMHVIALRDRCEQAALEGTWDLPFKDSRLPPLRLPLVSPRSVSLEQASGPASASTPLCISTTPTTSGLGEPEGVSSAGPSFSDDEMMGGQSPSGPSFSAPRPMSPDGIGSGIYSSVFMDAGMEGLLGYGAGDGGAAMEANVNNSSNSISMQGGVSAEDAAAQRAERRVSLREQASMLGREAAANWSAEKETIGLLSPNLSTVMSPTDQLSIDPRSYEDHMSALGMLSPPNSPRRRQTTFGATLDFIDALCTASSGLMVFPPEDREWALRRVLASINSQIEQASQKGVAVWFPVGRRARRVVRLAERESVLLNSREKAPFTLYVEVLDEEEAAKVSAKVAEQEGMEREIISGGPTPSRPPTLQRMSAREEEECAVGLPRELDFDDNEDEVIVEDEHDGGRLRDYAATQKELSIDGSESEAGSPRGVAPSSTASSSGGDSSAAAMLAVRASSGGDLGRMMTSSSRPHAVVAGTLTNNDVELNSRHVTSVSSPVASSETSSRGSPVSDTRSSSTAASSLIAASLAGARLDGVGAGTWIGHAPPSLQQAALFPAGNSSAPVVVLAQQRVSPSSTGGTLPPLHPQSVATGYHSSQNDDAVRVPSTTTSPTSPPPGGDLLSRGLASALAGLRGDAPLVKLQLEVIGDGDGNDDEDAEPNLSSAEDEEEETSLGGSAKRAAATRRHTVPASLTSPTPGPLRCFRPSFGPTPAVHPAHDGGGGGSGMTATSTRRTKSAGVVDGTVKTTNNSTISGEIESTKHTDVTLPVTCGKNGWSCKLGFCRACTAAAAAAAAAQSRVVSFDDATRDEQQEDDGILSSLRLPSFLGSVRRDNSSSLTSRKGTNNGPRVRVRLLVQGGVDLSFKRTPVRHARVPSHEALLKVARKHRLPAPVQWEGSGLGTVPEQQIGAAPTGNVYDEEEERRDQEDYNMVSAGEQQAEAALKPRRSGTSRTTALSSFSSDTSQPTRRVRRASTSTSTSHSRQTNSRVLSSEERVYGEDWAHRRARVQAHSPHGSRPGWDLACVMVKAGDDCRQELLAMQLIDAFREIWEEARLPLYLRTYEVLVTSSRTALIELVPNAPSIHAVKGATGMQSLRRHFEERYGEPGSPGLLAAQRNFVESMAAYSLVCYLLQIKDRHNGNILLDDTGHIIHIDFGFMLTNSPGGVNFESVPFKLTRELLEVMDSSPSGETSELFDYFKVLMIQGFLAVRRHADRILLLVEMMSNTGCPCFKNRAAAVAGLRKRFQLGLPEPALVEMVLGLIGESLDAWRTRQYDYYQRILNGVL